MGDHQERPGAVNLGPFVGVNLNLWPTDYMAVIVLTPGDVKWIKPKRSLPPLGLVMTYANLCVDISRNMDSGCGKIGVSPLPRGWDLQLQHRRAAVM